MATSNNEWLHIYQNNLTGPPQPPAVRWPGEVTDATTVTTTTASSVSNQLGRVTRPNNTRRRTRASRRTPTTLLNTDTTNFRAMVQQFTGGNFCGGDGGVSRAFMPAPAAVAPRQPLRSYNNINNNSGGLNYYGMGSMNIPDAVGGYNMEYRQPQQQQQHYYTVVADSGGGGGGDHQHGFVQRVQEGGM